MKWVKKGLIYNVNGKHGFDVTHCHKPTPLLIGKNTIRILFGTWDTQERTRTTFIDAGRHNPKKIKYIHDRLVLDCGKLRIFDDCGAHAFSLVWYNDVIFMYYIGWNPSVTVPTCNAIGITASYDGGITFHRVFNDPIPDRSKKKNITLEQSMS